MTESVYSGKDYEDKFDPFRFLERYRLCEGRTRHMLRSFYSAFKELPDNLKVLDHGSGPSLIPAIAAVKKASEITLCDFSSKNRDAIRQWLRGDGTSFDWTPHFQFVVGELEGNHKAIDKRQKKLRETVKAVVHCDLTQDPPIAKGYDLSYDVVISSLVIDTIAQNYAEFVQLLNRLGGLVKQGGTLMLYFIENWSSGSYPVGDHKFYTFPVSLHNAESAVAEAGYNNIKVNKFFCAINNSFFFFLQCNC